VFDYSIVPHVDSPDHPESTALGLVAEQYRRLGIRHKTLRDREVLIIDGTSEFVCPWSAGRGASHNAGWTPAEVGWTSREQKAEP
jgi:hypothetical protein